MADIPVEIKSLQAYLDRAKELENYEPAVSYWCRFWFVQKAFSVKNRSAQVNSYLTKVLEQLEQMKIKHKETPAIVDLAVAKTKVESFALTVFDNADREARARKATK